MKTREASIDPTLRRGILSCGAGLSCRSTFYRPAIHRLLPPNLHSSNPYCTAVFSSVPRNLVFLVSSLPTSLCRQFTTSLPSGMLTFPAQVPAIINYNVNSPRRHCFPCASFLPKRENRFMLMGMRSEIDFIKNARHFRYFTNFTSFHVIRFGRLEVYIFVAST
jgi:hypothetical protein